MIRFLIRRFLHGIVVLWIVATATFVLMRVLPGGPFDRERRLPPEVLANIEAKYQLDQPIWKQYGNYIFGILHGDLGPSYKYTDRSVTDVIADTLPVSVFLGCLALGFALLFAVPTGIVSAYFYNSWLDRACMFIATLGISLPHFILGAFLIWTFSLQLGWLQAARWENFSSAILPTLTLGAAPATYLTQLCRSSLLETLGENFIQTARAKGLQEIRVVVKHGLRPSLIPVFTVLGPLMAILLTGSFVVEYVFAIPGMGRFFITAVTDRDYPLIMGVTLVYTALLVGGNLIVDLFYPWIDPRIKSQ